MSDDNRGGPGGKRDDRRKGGSFKGGKGGFGKGPVKSARAETYESLKEVMRGEGFRIDKFQLAEKGTHKPVKTEYRLFREGLTGTHSFERLTDAQTAATAPLPEPEPVVETEIVAEAVAEETVDETPAEETPAEPEHSETPPA
jgi:hypothetical protein